MITKSKLLVITTIAAVVSSSSAFAMDQAKPVHARSIAAHSHQQAVRHSAKPKKHEAVEPLTPAERLEPFTAEEKQRLDAPDPYYHPDLF